MEDSAVSLRLKSVWIIFSGFFLGTLFFVLFWKQGFGLNVFVFLSTLIFITQISKFFIRGKFYVSKWDLLFIPFFLMGVGIVANNSLSMNVISSLVILGSLPFLSFLSLYPETLNRFSYLNSFFLYFQQMLSPFAGLVDFLKGVFKIKTHKLFKPTSLKLMIGFLLTVPLICILTALLMNADEAFSVFVNWIIDQINYFIREVLHLENIWDIFIWFLLVVGTVFTGIGYIIAKLKFQLKDFMYEQKEKGLDLIIMNVILGGINLLFLVFVFIQIKYLFFASGNFMDLGLTYSEYARRGFGELQFVTFIIGVVLYIVIRWGKKHGIPVMAFSKINLILLLINTLVILTSALFRLNLYFDAYGHTLLRFFPFVFMIFEFLLFLYLVPSVLYRPIFRSFSAYSFTLFLVFITLLTLISPEKQVAYRNQVRASDGEHYLDQNYLMSLSSDAWEDYLDHYLNSGEESYFLCQFASEYDQLTRNYTWHEYNASRTRVIKKMDELLKGKSSEVYLAQCSNKLKNDFRSLSEKYVQLIEKGDYEGIEEELWMERYTSIVDEMSDFDGRIEIYGNPVVEVSEFIDWDSQYPYVGSIRITYQIIQNEIDAYSTTNCISDYLSVYLENGEIKIGGSSYFPLAYGYQESEYWDSGWNRNHAMSTLEDFASNDLYLTNCSTTNNYFFEY